MRAWFRRGQRSDEILDLTAAAVEGGGLVNRWLRESLSVTAPEPAYVLRQRAEKRAV